MSSNKQLHAIVMGRVQGVSFRYYTRQRALQLGLRGWVRNRSDGSVEVLAQGNQRHLENLLDFLQEGPPSARVDQVQTEWQQAAEKLEPFTISYTNRV